MSHDGRVWVALLDLDRDGAVTAVSGEAASGEAVSGEAGPQDGEARVLVRVHGAPVGYVSIPVSPAQTLTERARGAAEDRLAGALETHALLDKDSDSAGGGVSGSVVNGGEWAARAGCPQRFPAPAGNGLSIIVCTRDRATVLSECLAALRQVTYSPVEILVVDNAPSSDATADLVRSLSEIDPRIRYTREPRAGLSRARNHGVAQATYDLLAFTDDDIVVDPGWASALVAGFSADPLTVCVTGLVAARSLSSKAERYFDSRYPWGEAFDARRYDMVEHRGDSRLYPFAAGVFGTGANFAVRRDTIEGLGGFDPRLGAGGPCRGGEDLDTFVRIVLRGGRLSYLPSALAWHQHRADDHALTTQVYAYGYGLGAYLAKRLLTRELTAAALLPGLRRSAQIAGRMRDAASASQFGARGRMLAVGEAAGVVAGAVRYFRVAFRNRGL